MYIQYRMQLDEFIVGLTLVWFDLVWFDFSIVRTNERMKKEKKSEKKERLSEFLFFFVFFFRFFFCLFEGMRMRRRENEICTVAFVYICL